MIEPKQASPPRLCVVNASLPPEYGGAEIAAYRYAERYRQAGGEVVLLAPSSGHEEEAALPDWVVPLDMKPGGGTKGRSRWLPGSETTRLAARIWPSLWRLRANYDVLHVFNSAPLFNLLAVPVSRVCGKPSVLEMSLRGSDDPLRLREWRPPGRVPLVPRPPLKYLLFRLGTRFVAKSGALRAAYLESGMPESRLEQIPYAVDTVRYRPPGAEEKTALRRKLGIHESKVQVLFVGGLTPRKGVHYLVEAFARLPRDLSVGLVLAGPDYKYDSNYGRTLRRRISEAGLEECVLFETRVVPNVEDYMRACDIFVLPSEREGLPISIIEAMSCGMAVVASDIPEIAESQITHGEEGYLFPVGNVDELAALCQRLVLQPHERDRVGAAARSRVERDFALTVVDRQYRRLYGELLAGTTGYPAEDE